MTDRRQAGAGLLRRAARMGASLSGPIDFAAELGADLLHWWQPSTDTITLNGGNVAQINDRVGGAHMAQASDPAQPQYDAAGGPNGKPRIVLDNTSKVMNATINLAQGRYGIYAVCSLVDSGNRTVLFFNDGATTAKVMLRRFNTGSQFQAYADFAGVGLTGLTITTPAFDTNPHLHAWRAEATGALYQIDGTTADPNFATSAELAEIVMASIGRSAAAGGSLSMLAIAANPSAAQNTIVRAYVAQEFAL